MKEYKIRIPNADTREQVLNKAYSLGYNWSDGICPLTFLGAANKLYIRDNDITYGESDLVFGQFDSPEISYQDFLRIGELQEDQLQPVLTTLNTNTEIMSELTLKCSKEPKNAKNLTVGNEYVGILIDADGTQVDAIKDAKYFMCTNNSGNEARYSISLFQEIAVQRAAPQRRPVPPLPPPVATAPFEDFINDTENMVFINSVEEDDEHYFIEVELANPREGEAPSQVELDDALDYYYSNVSCGVGQIDGLNDFYPELVGKLRTFNAGYYGGVITEEQIQLAAKSLLEAVLQKICVDRTKSFLVLSTNDGVPTVVAAMDQIADPQGNVSGRNVNSGNNIHVWIFKNV